MAAASVTDSQRSDIHSYALRLQKARDKMKHWKQEEDLARKRLLALMEPDSMQEFPDIIVAALVHERRSINQIRLRDEYPDVAEICTEVAAHTRIETHRRDPEAVPAPITSKPTISPKREKLTSPGYIESLIAQHLPQTEEMRRADSS